MEGFFALAEQHHTQADPAFCGLGSLVVALNALAIDPGRLWKGPWRWFSEELLDCCVPLTTVQSSGITIDEVACLASCNGASSAVRRTDSASEADLRRAVDASSRTPQGPVLIASYCRATLGQTGEGHFSPIGGYHQGRDLALILDVARFKYPPHWVPVEMLYRAMRQIDATTGRSRGWIELDRSSTPRNLAFVFTQSGKGWERIVDFLYEDLRKLLERHRPESASSALRLILEAAGDVIGGITLRETTDPQHLVAVETVLAELRGTALYESTRAAGSRVVPELATVLLYLLPRATTDTLSPNAAAELTKLTDIDALAEPLQSDLRVLRRQLDELVGCARTRPDAVGSTRLQ